MPRPSRLGLALAATVAASSLFVGGGLASADPVPCPDGKTAQDVPGCVLPGKAGGATTTTTTAPTTTTTSKAAPPAGTAGGAAGQSSAGNPPAGGGRPENGQNSGNGQKPPGCKPWKGDKCDPRKDRNDPPRRPGDEKDCRDFDNRNEAQKWFKDNGRPGDKDPSRLDRDKDGRACENDDDDGDDSDPVIPPKVDVTVIINQTEDDGSEAKTSGEQVKQVPEGSVDTGSAQ